ncbi:MAG TPA: hypothetical protein VMN39_08430, partial [Longimicrobiaceae bacterium]|nr:hypothetical protein [Longimicrobiaceae bacterium]
MNPSDGLGSGVIRVWRGVLRRRWKVGACLFAAILGLAALLVLTSRPIYRAEARLRLGEPPPMSGVSPNASIFGLFQLGGDPFANDLELLLSRTLTEGMVRDASLNATLRAPAGWHRDSLFVDFAASPATDEATFELQWEAAGVQVRRIAPSDSTVGVFPAGSPAEFGGLRVVPVPHRAGMPRQVQIRTVPFGEAVRVFSSQLVVERARREANVVGISFRGSDPALTRDVVASAIDRFVELRTAIQRRESGQTVDSLRIVANETLAELGQAERSMEELQRR